MRQGKVSSGLYRTDGGGDSENRTALLIKAQCFLTSPKDFRMGTHRKNTEGQYSEVKRHICEESKGMCTVTARRPSKMKGFTKSSVPWSPPPGHKHMQWPEETAPAIRALVLVLCPAYHFCQGSKFTAAFLCWMRDDAET